MSSTTGVARFISGVSVAMLLAAPAAAPAAAQAGAGGRAGVVTGTVMDDAGRPIEKVEISLRDSAVIARTDSAGEFVLTGLAPGKANLRFRRLGFAPVALMAQVPAEDTTDVEVTLTVVAQQLKGVIVQADAGRIVQLADFEDRRRQGIGRYVTRAQIEQRHPIRLSDMMRQIPGAVLVPDRVGQYTLRFAGAPHANCPPQYWVDGVMVMGFNIDDVSPGDIEGIELYSGPAGLPPQYNQSRGSTTICGTVLIWTRIPGN